MRLLIIVQLLGAIRITRPSTRFSRSKHKTQTHTVERCHTGHSDGVRVTVRPWFQLTSVLSPVLTTQLRVTKADIYNCNYTQEKHGSRSYLIQVYKFQR